MVPGAIFLLCGGGSPMAGAMVYTIISDVTPIAERAPVFYQMSALMLVLSAVLSPVSAWLMGIDPWLPVWLGEAITILGVFFALFVPETKRYRAEADNKADSIGAAAADERRRSHQEEASTSPAPDHGFLIQAWKTMRSDMMRIWHFILSSPHIMVLVVCEALIMPIGLAMLMYALQYITVRFSWDWSKVSNPSMFLSAATDICVGNICGLSIQNHCLRRAFDYSTLPFQSPHKEVGNQPREARPRTSASLSCVYYVRFFSARHRRSAMGSDACSGRVWPQFRLWLAVPCSHHGVGRAAHVGDG